MSDETATLPKVAPPPRPYMKPSPAYIAQLVEEMRRASEKAFQQKRLFEMAKGKIERQAIDEADARGLTGSARDTHIRGAFRDRAAMTDSASSYNFWKGECDRLANMIQAEEAAQNIITRFIGEGAMPNG